MFFNIQDVKQFLEHKDFIDTAIVPLLGVDLANDRVQQSSSAADFLMSLTAFIEQQFKGRLMVFPPFSYLVNTQDSNLPINLQAELQSIGFKYVFFVTCDANWTSLQEQVNIIWLPAIPLESMDKSVKKAILEDQLRQVVPLLTGKWSQQ